MEKNPCYEDYTLPVYEEVQLPNRAELADARVKLTERSASNIADNTNAEASIKKKTNWKAKCIGLVFSLSLLAFAMVIAIASSVYVSSNQGMDSLMKENQELMMQLNKTKMDIAKLKDDFTRIETDSFMENMAQLVNLLSSINALNITANDFMAALNSLQSSVSSLNTTNAATMTQLNSLQSLVSSLTTRVNSPVNLYQNCIQETRSCTIGPRAIDTYWTWCQTAFEPITKTVSLFWACMHAWMYVQYPISEVPVRIAIELYNIFLKRVFLTAALPYKEVLCT